MKQTLLAGIALAFTATGAAAHSKAKETLPADAATVASVPFIEMRFNDAMRITVILMSGPDGEVELTRETGMDPVTEFRALPPRELPDGAYEVNWRGMSSDGHPMQGSFAFEIAN
ncbi:copper resistance CopC family protein [Roseovarius nanhaiticus]|uniref:copper resistance CopC family protein n=1 Tax=Roseovarius nanhaiticus TaxID=573024 RepID=UPI00248F9C65|nr:copper resistance CopC family protein [Roseovarius nanhaiticus]